MAIDPPTSQTTSWRAVAHVLRSPLDAVSCVLFPSSCLFCGLPLPRLKSVPICTECWAAMPAVSGRSCARCGDSLPDSQPLCRACRLAPPPFVRAVSYGLYQGVLREAIHQLKYGRMRSLSRGLGGLLAEAVAGLRDDLPDDVLVVPVPLHRGKLRQRGFNQARALAAEAIAALRQRAPCWRLQLAEHSLMRLRPTESQAGLTPHQRRTNVRGAFVVSDAGRVNGRTVLLVDDILTTGATARAAAQALLEAGAASVWVATLARARRAADREQTGTILNEGEQKHVTG